MTGRIQRLREASENSAGVHKTNAVFSGGDESCVTATPARALSLIPQRRVNELKIIKTRFNLKHV